MSASSVAAIRLSPRRLPLNGHPYGVRGASCSWQAQNWEGGKLRRLRAAYRAQMVVTTWFGAYLIQ